MKRFSPDIKVSFVVPINQGPPFAKDNANLSGKVVTKDGDRNLITQDIAFRRPLGSPKVKGFEWIDPEKLEVHIGWRGIPTFRPAFSP